MATKVTCACGATAIVKDEFAGQIGQCHACGSPVMAGEPSPSSPAPPSALIDEPRRDFSQPTLDGMNIPATAAPAALSAAAAPAADENFVFSRDIFLLRQKQLAISEKYAVLSEDGTPLLFVERPAHLLRNLLALFAGVAAGIAVFAFFLLTFGLMPESARSVYILLGSLLGVAAIFAVYVMLEQKRHLEFYADESRQRRLLRVIQEKKFELFNATYSVLDAMGMRIGTFSKNHLAGLIRKHWVCSDPLGSALFVAREDSVAQAMLRRLLGPLFGLLRLNFIFCDAQNGSVLGEFNRSSTILDRYVLDMGLDGEKRIDRRLALAMGVMLDSGERR
jgi:hypothetical protein